MVFRNKRLSDLDEQDIQRLVNEQLQERDTIEYKRDMYGNSDAEKREMLKDITSFANHRGGYLLIGIDENEEGIPTKVKGVEAGKHNERIISSCLDNIEKRILGLEVKDVPLSDGKIVIVISIPESMNAPHMVTHTGLNQFWKRHGRQKDRMTIDEIGEAFDKRLSNLNRLDRFLFSRRADILETIGEQTFMIISASPTYLREEIILDIHDAELQNIMENPPRFQNTRGISCGCPYPTVNGLRADNHAPFGADNFPVRQYLEVFTNGYIEFAKLIKKDAVKGIAIRAFVEPPLIVDFVGFIRNVYERYVPLTPLTVKFSILNAKGIWLATNEFSEDDINVKWQKEHLDLGGFFTDNISVEGKLLGKEICDRLWQCFHHEKCFLIDESMTFRVPH